MLHAIPNFLGGQDSMPFHIQSHEDVAKVLSLLVRELLCQHQVDCTPEPLSSFTDVIVDADNEGCQVFLNVYHLNDDWKQANTVSKQVFGIGGAFHAGIEVHGLEWSYGGDGISCGPSRTHQVHVYHESILLGETTLSMEDVQIVIQLLGRQWIGEEYDLFEHNCCNFSDALSWELVSDSIPNWVTRFPKMAARAAAHLDSFVDVQGLIQEMAAGEQSPTTPARCEPLTPHADRFQPRIYRINSRKDSHQGSRPVYVC